MTKSELREKIKTIALQIAKPKSIDLDNGGNISLDSMKFPVLLKFPDLKKTIESLLTKQYEIFMNDIQWVAPRPTTFRIVLGNNEVFYLIYTERSWIAKVEGKKYYLLNLSEEEQAAESIARVLSYGINTTEEDIAGEFDKKKPKNKKPSTKSPAPTMNPDEFEIPEEPVEPEETAPEENAPEEKP